MSSYLKDNIKNFLLVNKAIPFVIFFYIIRFLISLSRFQWFFIWVSLELLTLCFIPLMYISKKSLKTIERMTSYFVVQGFSSLILILRLVGNEIINYRRVRSMKALILISIIIKVAAVPTHRWFPQVSRFTRKFSFNLLLTFQKIQPFAFLLIRTPLIKSRILFYIFISTTFSSVLNIQQNNIKYILVYSRISHTSWILLAILTSYEYWLLYFSIYTFRVYILTKTIKQHSQQIFLLPKHVLLTWRFYIFNLAGIPPLLGFYPKILIIDKILTLHLEILLFVILAGTILDFFIYTRISHSFYWLKYPNLIWSKKTNNFKGIIILILTILGRIVVFF